MFCPQCGTESPPSLQYCRLCGANLKVIGKAVTLSEAIARSDRGLLPKIKGMVKNLNVEQVTEEISGALQKMNDEIVRSSKQSARAARPWWQGEKKSPERRREDERVKGTVSFFSGIGVTLFFYYFAHGIVLKLPPDVIAKIPFEIEPLIGVLWTLGLIPILTGVGHLTASLFIRSKEVRAIESPNESRAETAFKPAPAERSSMTPAVGPAPALPVSITEHTTELLKSDTLEKNA